MKSISLFSSLILELVKKCLESTWVLEIEENLGKLEEDGSAVIRNVGVCGDNPVGNLSKYTDIFSKFTKRVWLIFSSILF